MTMTLAGASLLAAGAVAHPGGETGTIQNRATATYSDGVNDDRLYVVRSHGEDSYLRVRCAGPQVAAVYHVIKSPRDAGSGLATGKRMHKPFTITKEWGASTPLLGKSVGWAPKGDHGDTAKSGGTKTGYDVKKVEGSGARAKPMAHDDWHEVHLTEGAPALCG